MDKSFALFALLICVIHGQTINESDNLLIPNYDNLEHKLKAFSIRRPLVLHCNITRVSELELSWQKNDVEVSKVDELRNRYDIIESENKFVIQRTEQTDSGNYSCHLGNIKKEFHVLAKLVVNTPTTIVVPEFEDLLISCEVAGSMPNIHWEFGNLTINNNSMDRYQLKMSEDKVENAVLLVKNVTLDLRGDFTCVARNILTQLNITAEARYSTFVRVKSHLAALWPALGILAQVVILGIITIFARKADKKINFE